MTASISGTDRPTTDTSPAAHAQEFLTEPKKHYRALDGYRALAILMVFTVHYAGTQGSQTYALPSYGWIGVDLFFVLSGFLITGILYDSRHSGGTLQTFYMRRVLRIFPLYYGVVLLLFLAGITAHAQWVWQQALWPLHLGNYARFLGRPPLDIIRTDLLVRRNHSTLLYGHFWSLCVEEQFYLIWPLIVFWIRDRKRLIGVCAAVLLIGPLLRIAAVIFAPAWMLERQLIYKALPFRLDALLCGALLALLLRGRSREWLTRWRIRLGIFGVCAVSSVFFIVLALGRPQAPLGVAGDSPWLTGFGYSLIDLGAAAIILFLLNDNSRAARLLCLPPLRALGIVSYGCYVFHDLFHITLLTFVQRHGGGHPWLMLYVLAFCQMILLATLSYHFYEKPFLRLKTRFRDNVHRIPAA